MVAEYILLICINIKAITTRYIFKFSYKIKDVLPKIIYSTIFIILY